MTLGELIVLFREEMMDMAEPYLNSDPLLTIYANEGQDEACRRGDLLIDSGSGVCRVRFRAHDESVAIDQRVLNIKMAHCDGYRMSILDQQEMTCTNPFWLTAPAFGRPLSLVQGMATNKLYLWPRPERDGEIRLTVRRLPLDRMEEKGDEPEIRLESHVSLVQWMLYRAYGRTDAEAFNAQKAAIALASFETEFGKRPSARNEQWIRDGNRLVGSPLA